jgi:hypothetical protein
MFSFFKKKPLDLAQHVDTLRRCGVVFPHDFSLDKVLENFDAWQFQQQRYDLLLLYLCGEDEDPKTGEWKRRAPQFYGFDLECVEEPGVYSDITKSIAAMSGSTFPLENIRSEVDLDEEKAELSFDLKGKNYTLTPAFDNDWFDVTALKQLAELHESLSTGHRFYYVGSYAQDCMMCCLSDIVAAKLKTETGMTLTPLKEAEL